MATNKVSLFLRLAQPDERGFSRWVNTSEFTGEYEDLKFGNGGSWIRTGSSLDRRYNIEKDCSLTAGNSIDRLRLVGYKQEDTFRQTIRQDIRDYYAQANCVMLGLRGNSVNTKIEIDHKDGRKLDPRVSNTQTQRKEDFQPLCKAANDAKRQICKVCKETGKRWNAKNLLGNPYAYYEGGEEYSEELGCVGCYQYDPVAYRFQSAQRIIQETSQDLIHKLYPELTSKD